MTDQLSQGAIDQLKSLFGKGYAQAGGQTAGFTQLHSDGQNSPFLASMVNTFVDSRGGKFVVGAAGGGTRYDPIANEIVVDANTIDRLNGQGGQALDPGFAASIIGHELGHALLKFGSPAGSYNVDEAVRFSTVAEGSAFLSEAIIAAQLSRGFSIGDQNSQSHPTLDLVQRDVRSLTGLQDLSSLRLDDPILAGVTSFTSSAIADGGNFIAGSTPSTALNFTYLTFWKASTALNTAVSALQQNNSVSAFRFGSIYRKYGDTIPFPTL